MDKPECKHRFNGPAIKGWRLCVKCCAVIEASNRSKQ